VKVIVFFPSSFSQGEFLMSTDATPSTDEAIDDERKAPPVFRQQFGRVTLSIWERHTKDGTRIFYEYSLKRSYRDDQQQWKNAYSFGCDDSGDVQLAVSRPSDGFGPKVKSAQSNSRNSTGTATPATIFPSSVRSAARRWILPTAFFFSP
jgi:hypothetical protein